MNKTPIMKQLLILLLAIPFYTCSGSKKAIENEPKPPKDIAVASQKQNSDDIPEPKSNDGEIHEMIEVVDNKGNIIAEVSSKEEAEEVIKNKDNTANNNTPFHQQLSKREGYIHDAFDEILQDYVSEDGNVNYKNLKNAHKDVLGYIKILTALYPQIDKVSTSEKLAYWINAYNALTIDLILRHYPLKSIKDIKDPWDQRLWQFGDKWLNLNDIEHKMLRKMNEPRIHFAIVCASESCPKLLNKAYTSDNLEEQLTTATKAFLSDTSKNEISENSIKLSKIFKWFAKDFKTEGSLIDFLNRYSEITISKNAKKSYKNYDWSLND